MTTTTQTAAFAGVMVLGVMSPGPDFAVVVRRAAVSGRAHGMAAAAGVAVGVLFWAVAAATGVAALLTLAPLAFTVIKLAGAAYLLYLGVRALRSALATGVTPDADTGSAVVSGLWPALRDGVLCNALNPKAAVFFIALLPQFLPARPGFVDSMMLCAIAVAITLAWFLTVANLVAGLRRIFALAAVRRAVDALGGLVLVGLGIRLAVTQAD